jgi:hypothetical protein
MASNSAAENPSSRRVSLRACHTAPSNLLGCPPYILSASSKILFDSFLFSSIRSGRKPDTGDRFSVADVRFLGEKPDILTEA